MTTKHTKTKPSCSHAKVARSKDGKYLVTKCEKCDITLRRELHSAVDEEKEEAVRMKQ